MTKYKPRDGELRDIEEFGDGDLIGDPTVAKLIRALPEDQREAYREKQRAFVADMCETCSLLPCTYAEYLAGNTRRK